MDFYRGKFRVRGDVDDSRRLFVEAEAAFRDIGTNRGLVGLSWQRANLEFHAGDLQASQNAWQTAIEAAERAGLEATVHDYRVGLALCELELGDETAGAPIREGIRELFDLPEIRTGTKHALLQNLIVARAGADDADDHHERVATAAGVSERAEDQGNPVRWDLRDVHRGCGRVPDCRVASSMASRRSASRREDRPCDHREHRENGDNQHDDVRHRVVVLSEGIETHAQTVTTLTSCLPSAP